MTAFVRPPVAPRMIKTAQGTAIKPAPATKISAFLVFEEGENIMRLATREIRTARATGAAWSFARNGQPRNSPAVAQAISRDDLELAPPARKAAAAKGTVVRNTGNCSLE